MQSPLRLEYRNCAAKQRTLNLGHPYSSTERDGKLGIPAAHVRPFAHRCRKQRLEKGGFRLPLLSSANQARRSGPSRGGTMYSDSMRAALKKHDVAILLRLFPNTPEDDAAFYLDIAAHYCKYPADRTEVVATATKIMAGFENQTTTFDLS
jgi:hypothetical protein